jgi:alpha-glucosidase (family GH31 glycosyl hydrolase)
MPLYVRAGSIIPMGPVKQYAAENVAGPLTLVIYPGADATFALYEDDGATFNYRRGEFMRIEMIWNDSRRSLTLRLAKGSRMLPPLKRNIEVRVVGEKASHAVAFEGRPVEIQIK